ncbi:DUF1045 domain-containing protein [Xanthobacter sp. YC-JY1]|uniref:DUF1045 domain-containing protein n=1 Tax=Xanthobacter sp. YC-JY1 TaxID=2419844 RepID=UPI001F293001|nr:DUF1045 domain-containing protein [Xanthobacter sp. YC-JY1]UJX47585.1 DUF1045 domain-containing protein [Xanthobacter sp. YC-JY1]
MTAARRYAVYLAPPADGALWRFGSAVLGYDAETGDAPAAPDIAGFDAEAWHAATAEPRRYGFHGTLKAPFRLADGASEDDLAQLMALSAAGHHAFEMPPLEVRAIGSFVALVPAVPSPKLEDLARSAVLELDGLRAPLSESEIARRKPERLSARQLGYLEAYGYPYVLDEFRFHMTLTGPLPEPERVQALNALTSAFAASGADVPATVTDMALYVEEPGARQFRLVRRFPMRAAQ